MRNKSHGLEAGDVLTYNEYLDNANAEMSPDTAPTLIPVLDEAGNVTMTSFDGELVRGAVVLETAQDLGGSISGIDTEHWYIHRGLHFFDGRVLEIPANQTFNWVVETGEKAPHVSFEVSPTNGGVAIMTYENITANADGTLITPLNNNRLSATASTVKFRLNPTGVSTAGATTIRGARIGTIGGTAQRTGGNLARTNELIFKKNTKYLLTIQNLNNDTVFVNLVHQWYENSL